MEERQNMDYQVLSPIGEPIRKPKSIAPRLQDLNGKTVCEVGNDRFKIEVMFPILRELLKKRYPDVRIVPYTEFPLQPVEGSGKDLIDRANNTAQLVKARGADAVISGNGF
jgi:hypothetical protein